ADGAAAGALLGRLRRRAARDNDPPRTRLARPERGRKVLGVPGRRIDRLLQVHAAIDVAQEELRGPLVLLVATGRAPGEIRLTVAQRDSRRKRSARALAGRERIGMTLVEPELLRAGAETEPELGDHGRGLQPAA